jgi:hypothetical protein
MVLSGNWPLAKNPLVFLMKNCYSVVANLSFRSPTDSAMKTIGWLVIHFLGGGKIDSA